MSLQVRRLGQRHQDQAPIDGVMLGHGVTGRVDVRIVRGEVPVDDDPAIGCALQARITSELRVRAHPDGGHHQVGIQDRLVGEGHVVVTDGGDRAPQVQVDPGRAQRVAQVWPSRGRAVPGLGRWPPPAPPAGPCERGSRRPRDRMKPPPVTASVRACWAAAASASASSTLRRVSAHSMPGIDGRTGVAPGASTSRS